MTSRADQYSFRGTSSPDTHSFKEKGRDKHLRNNSQGRLVYLCPCSTTSTAQKRTKKNNNLKMSWRSVPMQSKFDRASGVSVDLVLKNMVQRWHTRKGLGPRCDTDAERVRHRQPSNMIFIVHLRFLLNSHVSVLCSVSPRSHIASSDVTSSLAQVFALEKCESSTPYFTNCL